MTRPGRRRALPPALLAGLAAGCMGAPERRPRVEAVAPPQPPRSQFAELVRAPGQRVAFNPPTGVLTVENREPALDAPKPPPAAPVATVELPPPNPVAPPPDPPVVAAVRHAADGRTDLSADALRGLAPANREATLQILPALVKASREPVGPGHPRDSGELADQLQAAADRLRTFAPLRIDAACFCRNVRGFGRYDARPAGASFAPRDVAELYVQPGNVPSVPATRPGDGDGFLTALACRMTVRDDATGQPVPMTNRDRQTVQELTETRHDFARAPLRDYYLRFLFPVPAAPGSYTVTVEVRDPASGRAATRAVPLRVE